LCEHGGSPGAEGQRPRGRSPGGSPKGDRTVSGRGGGARRSAAQRGDSAIMATVYSPEYKASIIERMLPPNNVSVTELVSETGIPKDTLYSWRSRARAQGLEAAQASATRSTLSSEEKFAVVVESAALNEVELGEYCRRKGLYPQQIAAWKASCMQANAVVPAKQARAEVRVHKQQLKALERELRRKDKALAEAAALLVLEKKLQTVRSADAGERSTWSNDAP